MRLDKFLKVSRIIKRRTIANEVCDQGKVNVNGRIAKAGTEVKEGDILTLALGQRVLKIEIVRIAESIRADEAKDLYKIISENRQITL